MIVRKLRSLTILRTSSGCYSGHCPFFDRIFRGVIPAWGPEIPVCHWLAEQHWVFSLASLQIQMPVISQWCLLWPDLDTVSNKIVGFVLTSLRPMKGCIVSVSRPLIGHWGFKTVLWLAATIRWARQWHSQLCSSQRISLVSWATEIGSNSRPCWNNFWLNNRHHKLGAILREKYQFNLQFRRCNCTQSINEKTLKKGSLYKNKE